ncbi:MAG: dUTP diphosphatase [Candidatus Cloacimonetes bacterium]|nr:dUTP diphosphatase [Candidatus Cloacimonadota bacterium]
MITVKIQKLKENAMIPRRMTEHAAGYDLYSANNDDIIIAAGKVALIPTGIAVALPIGFEAQIRPRSGLAFRNWIGILNSPGTIDADYRGEIKVILFNFGAESYCVKPGTRIAQMVITRYQEINFEESENLDQTARGDGGFGHTND